MANIYTDLAEAYKAVYAPQEVDEATAMAKRGHDETAIRQKIAASTGGGKSADRATELANRQVFKGSGSARDNLARAQRGDFRKTTSSNPGLHVGQHKSDDPAVKAKQAARGAQRGVLTPAERGRLNREEVEYISEEVQIAAQYFYEMGLNEDGVDILIEELGVEEFGEFVYDISEEYVLTEARASGAKIEVKTAKGKEIQGKPTTASLKRLRTKKEARKESEAKASESKPSGMTASLKRQSAVVSAAKKQPKKPGFLDRVAGAVNRGIVAAQERASADIEKRKKFMSAAKETGKTLRKAAGKVGGVAKEVGKGASGAAKLAGHVASKGIGEEVDIFDVVLEYLVAEDFAETNQEALDLMAYIDEELIEEIIDEARRADELGHARGTAANPSRKDIPHSDPSQRSMLHSKIKSRADAMGRERRNSPRYRAGGRPPVSPKEKAFLRAKDNTGRSVRNPNVPDTGRHQNVGRYDRQDQQNPKRNPKHNANKG